MNDIILFKAGSEFLICHTHQDGNVFNVYLRQVELGFSQAVALWLDDLIYQNENKNLEWIQYNQFNNFDVNPKFVTASHT